MTTVRLSLDLLEPDDDVLEKSAKVIRLISA